MKSPYPTDWNSTPTHSTQQPDDFVVKIKSLKPTYASKISRYNRRLPNRGDEKAKLGSYLPLVERLTMDYDDDEADYLPASRAGWKRVVHPEGALYWFRQQQACITLLMCKRRV
ncbi:hypothetical protein CONPUDRAFT_148356 [Coniophora puteana RWD-64-598 SS2]|uniref:Uncharacterized protein n=1 Tax=Coniophora puteana (strain RWD-64-598) TaxID=741705 RepID=A0A5M3N5X3_CONPW|nr:uncharacterized protein CONPUDRAFT_148356 [Coniophora puteana RWD-64-598 SS2]EIW86261.1 hypothetical protein CONPUDRAFT_148356 [Coniophora puteana RWD-64-598 SS2]